METKTAISANELMLGNWVRHATHKYVREWLRGVPILVDLDVMEKILNPPMIDPMFEPIPLSAEILVKCGFVNTSWATLSRDLGEYTVKVVWNYEDGHEYTVIFELRKFEFVKMHDAPLHKLQNTVTLLTGQPLTIEL